MCGISAVIGFSADLETITAMTATLAHRGPDGQAVDGTEGSALLGACRLAITGLGSSGSQPMRDPTGRYLLAFNGEIYNHRLLRAELDGVEFAGSSDTETLLHLLIRWGEDALPRLEGMFAFVFVDTRNGVALAARDRLGVKPLYFSYSGDAVYLASELKALHSVLGAPPSADMIRASLTGYWVNGYETPLGGICRLGPGQLLRCETKVARPKVFTWHDLPDWIDPLLGERLANETPGGLTDEVEVALSAAIRQRLPEETPAGVLCSGGLDSSLVLALAHRAGAEVLAFVATFPGQPDADEAAWAELACSTVGARLLRVPLDRHSWREGFVAAVHHFEYPLVHQNTIALTAIGRRARELGVRVLLSGEGADELFGGYPSRHHRERLAFADEHGPDAPAPRLELRAGRASLSALVGPAATGSYDAEVVAALRNAYAGRSRGRRDLSAALSADLRLFLSHGLNRLDKNLMQVGVEVREPFLDSAVVRLGLNLPLEHLLDPAPKGVLGRAARRLLPSSIVDRPKHGFNFDVAPYLAGLRSEALLDGRLRELLERERSAWRSGIEELSARDLFRLWSGEIWCRLFVDRSSPAKVGEEIWTT